MQNVIVSLNKNILKLSLLVNDVFNSFSTEVSNEVVSGSVITDVNQFSVILNDSLQNLNIKAKKNLGLVFVAEPQDIYMHFVIVGKDIQDAQTAILDTAQKKLDVDINETYFSYQKIAPFVYQFVATKKAYLENYMEVANNLQMPVNGVLPWVSLLPQYVGTIDPAVFISKVQDEQVVVLSELGGIFFLGVYDEEKSTHEIQKIVEELSAYNRTKPINKIFTINYESFDLSPSYEITKITMPQINQPAEEFEMNLLVGYMIDFAPDLLASQDNLLTLLPLPAMPTATSLSVIKSGSVIAGVLVAGVVLGGFLVFRNNTNKNAQLAMETANQNSAVLSETIESTASETPPVETKPEVKPEVKREGVVVRVENASGINGIAGSTQKSLNGLGYDVKEIDTADETRENTLIKIKASKEGIETLLSEDLKANNPNIEVQKDLAEDTAYDVLVVIGTSVKN